MKRVVCLVAGFLVLVIGAGTAVGQTFMAGFGRAGASLFPRIPGLGSYDVAGTKLTASARAGYQWIGLNFNLPTSSPIGFADSAPIDIQLKDAHVWVGSVGLDAQLTPRMSIFANGEANAKTEAGAVSSDDPLRYVTGLVPYRWNATGLEWWAVEGGAAYRIFDGAAIFGGLRRDYLAFGLTNPRDRFGNPINEVTGVPGVSLLTNTNAADLQVKLWIPYVGLRVIGMNYRATIIWSPFVNAAVKIPDAFVSNIFVFPAPGSTILNGFEWRYSMFQTGSVVEGELDYDVRLGSNLLLNAWAKGSWLRIRGKGALDEIKNDFVGVSVQPPIRIFTSLQGDRSATGTLSRSIMAVGLSLKAEF